MVGPKGLKGDDYVMFVTLIMYAICAVMVDLVYRYGTNVDLVADQIELLSDAEVAQLVNGSKFQQVAWYSYTAYLWSLKVALLFFYSRMTFALWQHERVLTYLTWFTVASYLAVVGTITFSCRPFRDNWGVRPLPHDRCVFKAQNLVVTTLLNVLTDAAILSLPLPVLREIRVPMYKKVFIAALLCSGLFVMAASIMRVAATMGSEPSTLTVNRWGVRELELPSTSAKHEPDDERKEKQNYNGRGSQVDVEVDSATNDGEIERLNETEEVVIHEQERYRDIIEEEEERG
ncbi:hypothetical protein CkaCkLH20_07343 [Colletotrichum karsti]|uniref:Rhodopsin domain-containing protein n=1 Tax=Colletotrichum karsti TaxID=1095194 RepID=A0A9P6I3G5_9PEZI|nr:uncharacterized protein CkaCkLH20_07343 [Colletotrichum karsti]KAF9875077.1 hypothetical protein CkaCkLH20_07343 [Colletotrichum karsti]